MNKTILAISAFALASQLKCAVPYQPQEAKNSVAVPLSEKSKPVRNEETAAAAEQQNQTQDKVAKCFDSPTYRECQTNSDQRYLTMERQIPPQEKSTCLRAGDYLSKESEQCIEGLLQQHFTNQPVYSEYTSTKEQCAQILQRCENGLL
jgi:hypothetical protein